MRIRVAGRCLGAVAMTFEAVGTSNAIVQIGFARLLLLISSRQH